MLRRTITFRQVFITQTVLLLAVIVMHFFTASTSPLTLEQRTAIAQYEEDLNDRSYDDEMLENMRDYQVTLDDNGAQIWDGERFVGYLPFNTTCAFQKLMIKDNHR